jgi:hypothetical protein
VNEIFFWQVSGEKIAVWPQALGSSELVTGPGAMSNTALPRPELSRLSILRVTSQKPGLQGWPPATPGDGIFSPFVVLRTLILLGHPIQVVFQAWRSSFDDKPI